MVTGVDCKLLCCIIGRARILFSTRVCLFLSLHSFNIAYHCILIVVFTFIILSGLCTICSLHIFTFSVFLCFYYVLLLFFSCCFFTVHFLVKKGYIYI